jgi:hypothetical protein
MLMHHRCGRSAGAESGKGQRNVARRCVFCDRAIPDGAPPEHVIPRWISKFRPKGAVFRHITYPEQRGETHYPPSRPIFSAKRFELTADTVCADCNHHWMSDLEAKGSPILTPMIEGSPQGLRVDQQVLLGQWVAKTALAWDQSMKPESRMYALEHCRWLRDHGLPPPGATVRLGKFAGTGDFVQMVYDAMYLEVPTNPIHPGPPTAHRSTIRIGQLITEFTVASDPRAVLAARVGDIANLLITIWPSTDITSWPPRVAFDDDAWSSFVKPDIRPLS